MDMLEDARKEIDEIDCRLASLVERRMQVAANIAAYKREHSLPVEDKAREDEIISTRSKLIADPVIRKYYVEFLQDLFKVSKHYQSDLLGLQNSGIVIGRGNLLHIEDFIPMKGKILILTDSGVPEQYAKAVADKAEDAFIYTIQQGEASKNVGNWVAVLSFMKEKNFTRTDSVVSVGGGVVSDLAGFVAATYMRGIRYYNVPTTLLAQIDASVGGKTAVDFEGIKNMAGAFYQPCKVVIDPDTLKTLPERQLHSGLVESIKMAATFDEDLFELIENSKCIEDDLEEIIRRSVDLKKDIVDKDPMEKDLRRVLNFGHTVGHAVESLGEGKYLHGEAVGIGMRWFSSEEVWKRIEKVLMKYNLPVKCHLSATAITDLIRHDKKATDDEVWVVKVEKLGTFNICKSRIDDLKI